MQNYAAVVDVNGKPLTPSRNLGKLWSLVRKGKARLVSRTPLHFQLLYKTATSVVKPVTVGIDTGRENVGLAVLLRHTNTSSVVFAMELETRNKDVTKHMSERRQCRQARRRGERLARKRLAKRHGTEMGCDCLFRQYPGYEDGLMTVKDIRNTEPRFLNRKRPDDWLTPTARNLVQAHISLIQKIAKYFPVKDICVEIPKFAFMLMEDGTVHGSDFQDGRMHGYNGIREYVLARDNGVCVVCGKPAQHLHHVRARHLGGSNLPENLVSLCEGCHTCVHHGELHLAKTVRGMFKKYHHLSVLNIAAPFILKELTKTYGEECVHPVSGRETAAFRSEHFLQKEHWTDAVAIACVGTNLSCPDVLLENAFHAIRFRRHNRQKTRAVTERTYKFEGKVFAKNRKQRFEQKGLSLQDYRQRLEEDLGTVVSRQQISKLTVFKSNHVKNNTHRIMPGAVFLYKGSRYVVSGTHAKNYFRAVGQGKKDFRISDCRILCQNTGIVVV